MIVKRVKIGDQSWELQKSASISYEKNHFYTNILYV